MGKRRPKHSSRPLARGMRAVRAGGAALAVLLAVSFGLGACTIKPPAPEPSADFVTDPGYGRPMTAAPRSQRDGAPRTSIDFAALPDAVPRAEPRSRYGNPPGYVQDGVFYQVMASSAGYVERGIASWYGTKFHGRRTSSGEPYDMYAMTAAHTTLPLPSFVRVTNLENGRSIVVRVNDRGPFVNNRIIDLSYAAAGKLGFLERGTGLVEVEVIDPAAPKVGTLLASTKARAGGSASAATELYLQVGAFSDLQNADRLHRRLSEDVAEPVRITEGRSAQATVYRVRIGPIASVEDADRMMEALARIGISDPRIIVE